MKNRENFLEREVLERTTGSLWQKEKQFLVFRMLLIKFWLLRSFLWRSKSYKEMNSFSMTIRQGKFASLLNIISF